MTTTKRPDGGKLKPCPFCGDRAWFSGFVVQCKSCGASLIKQERGAAIEAWNTRTPTNESPAPQPPVEGRLPERETFWLIERIGHGQWIKDHGYGPNFDLTNDVWHARRYDTERDAHDRWRYLNAEDRRQYKLAEHIFIHGAALASPSLTAGADSGLRRAWLDKLNAIAPAVENLAGHQEQCDFDGVMVKVSRQALDQVLNAVNDLAVSFVTAPAALTEQPSEAPAPASSVREAKDELVEVTPERAET